MADNIVSNWRRATIRFCDGVSVDGYQMPDGSFRVGLSGAAVALGFASTYLNQSTQPKALLGLGFEGKTIELASHGGQAPKTISLEDFSLLTLYAATKGKHKAIALSKALIHLSYTDFFRDAFGERQLSIAEKRELFYKAYAATINWLLEDKADALALIAWR